MIDLLSWAKFISRHAVIVALAFIALNMIPAHPARAGMLEQFEVTKIFPEIDEFRFGVLIQDLEASNSNSGGDLNLEILFGRIGRPTGDYLIDHFFMPRPHIGVNIDFDGETSQAYFGVTWDVKLTEWLYFESSFGGAVHDGELNDKDEASFGCTLNFRESAAIGVALSEKWRMQVTVDHMSNAGLCDRNDGLTNGGIRFGYRW